MYPTDPPSTASVDLAAESVTAFQELINSALENAYGSATGSLVDVTAATGAYKPLSDTVVSPKYGTIPKAVYRVCKVSWFCTVGDIHADTHGYTIIGKLIVAQYDTDVKK